MSAFKTPGPYRIWLRQFTGDVDSVLEDTLADAVVRTRAKNAALRDRFGFGLEERWDVDQRRGTLTLHHEDGGTVRADVQIAGTFNGTTWLWAWDNPSIPAARKKDAMAIKALGQREGWTPLVQATWTATPADGEAMSALCGDQSGADGTHVADVDCTLVFFTVRGARRARSAARQGKPDVPPALSLAELTAPLFAADPRIELSIPEHRAIQRACNEGEAAIQRGEFARGIELLGAAWERLGEWKYDRAPAGHILVSLGNALLLAGRFEEARARLFEALLHGRTASGLLYLRLAQCELGRGNRSGAARRLLQAHVAGGDSVFAGEPTEQLALLEETLRAMRTRLDARVESLVAKDRDLGGDASRVRAIALCLGRDIVQFERAAHHMSSLEEPKREESHVMTDREIELREEFDQSWAAMLAVYCTPQRRARCPGWGWRPEVTRESYVATEVDGDRARVVIHSKCGRKWHDSTHEYELVRSDGRWMIESVLAVHGDEKLRLF